MTDVCVEKILKLIPEELKRFRSWMVIYIAMILLNIRDAVETWLASLLGDVNNIILHQFDTHRSLGVITAIFAVGVVGRHIYREYRNCHISVEEIALPVVVGYYTLWDGWKFAAVTQWLDMRGVILIACVTCILLSLYKMLMLLRENDNSSKTIGFVRKPLVEYSDGRKEFARYVADKIRATSLSGPSLSVGISGEWGSGKTKFLGYLREALEADYITVDFNPWECQSPGKIVERYFAILRNRLSPYNHELFTGLPKYAASLVKDEYNGPMAGVLSSISDVFETEGNGNLKTEIGEMIDSLSRPVLVFIDDIDRLDGKELFETLRLVRNTADFHNLIYVIAYDRHYVVNTLKNSGIAEPSLYLEKIVDFEMWLPSYEPLYLIKAIYGIITKNISYRPGIGINSIAYTMMTQRGTGTPYLLFRFINNYRKALRFANMLLVDLEYMNSNGELGNLNLTDFFWLEVIRYASHEDYRMLRDNPEYFFSIKNNTSTYSLKEDVHLNNEDIRDVLCLLFDKRKYGSLDLAYLENYNSYFALRVLGTSIGDSEFSCALSTDRRNYILKRWLDTRPKLNASVNFRFENASFKNQTREWLTDYIDLIIEWYCKSADTSVCPIIRTKIVDEMPSAFGDRQALSDVIMESINRHYDLSTGRPSLIARLINALCPDNFFEDEETGYHLEAALVHTDLKELATKAFDSFAKDATVDELLDKASDLVAFMTGLSVACYIMQTGQDEDIVEYDLIIWPHILETFVKNGKSTSLKEFVRTWGLSAEERNEMYEFDVPEIGIRHQNSLNRIFGSRYHIEELIDKCFEATDEEKDAAKKMM